MDYWPLLDIREALADCERTLAQAIAAEHAEYAAAMARWEASRP